MTNLIEPERLGATDIGAVGIYNQGHSFNGVLAIFYQYGPFDFGFGIILRSHFLLPPKISSFATLEQEQCLKVQ
jgi:hypothetical protein